MFGFSMPELILVAVVALVAFGPSKLPEVGKALGKSLQEFRRAMANDHADDPVKTIEVIPEKKV